MEDTLRENVTVLKNIATKGLNPCFNGRYSQSKQGKALVSSIES